MNARAILLEILTVLSSFTTLLCCALPALLVSLGAGAVLASLVTAVPQLVWISEHKTPLFAFAGVMLLLSGIYSYRQRNAPCPTDPLQAKSCLRLRRISARIFYLSLLVYAIGFFFAFLISRIS
jgi:TRAP-type C4-dicarboxylate transport system permease small subunit